MRNGLINGIMEGRTVGKKIAKAWLMKPRARAGARIVAPKGGHASPAAPKTKTVKVKAPTDEKQAKHRARG